MSLFDPDPAPLAPACPTCGRRTDEPRCPLGHAMGPAFDGATYEPDKDRARLTGALARVHDAMLADWHTDRPMRWWTLADLAAAAGCSEASASARLRDLRKPRYGEHVVERERVEGGLYVYRVAPALDTCPACRR